MLILCDRHCKDTAFPPLAHHAVYLRSLTCDEIFKHNGTTGILSSAKLH